MAGDGANKSTQYRLRVAYTFKFSIGCVCEGFMSLDVLFDVLKEKESFPKAHIHYDPSCLQIS